MTRLRCNCLLSAFRLFAGTLLVTGCGASGLARADDPASTGNVSQAAVIAAKQCAGANCSSSAQCSSQSNCKSCDIGAIDASAKPTLAIRWKRGVDESGKTVASHRIAEQQVDQAFTTLKASLAPLGVEVVLQKAELSELDFIKYPAKSNRIWLNGASIEMYLPEGAVGEEKDSQSGEVFRTVEFAGVSFRDVPHALIVHAGLIAAADAVKQSLEDMNAVGLVPASASSCCPGGSTCSPGAKCAAGSCGPGTKYATGNGLPKAK